MSDFEIDVGQAGHDGGVTGQDGAHLELEKLVDLLRRPADEGGRIEQLRQSLVDGRKVLAGRDALDQVVVTTLLLDDVAGLLAEDADVLVALLPVAALLDHGHDDVLGGHEGQLHADVALDDARVDDETLGDVL